MFDFNRETPFVKNKQAGSMTNERLHQVSSENQCVVAVFDQAEQAQRAVRTLREHGLPADRLSLVAASVEQQAPEIREQLEYGDKAVRDAAIGAGVGGVAGLLIGATALAVSGLGLVFAAGPVAVGLAGSVLGAFLGGMRGWGVSPDRVEKYEEMVRAGKLLLIVHGPPLEVVDAKEELEQLGAGEVHLHASTGADSPEVDDRPET